ncbi:MAG: STAS domain-containing protein [Ilumatobacter sp.]|nr:STAS domain-containing protein [Ilumatobacter sp.]
MIDLRCVRSDVGGRPVLAIDGIADLAALPRLHDELQRFTADHPGDAVAIDVDGLAVLDDAALGLLLGAAATARAGGGDLTVVCTERRLRERLELTGFARAVPVTTSLSAAVSDRAGVASYDRGMGEDRKP